MVVADQSVLRGIPEFFENEPGEAIVARTEALGSFSSFLPFFLTEATFRELGPPDLVHIEKSAKGQKDVTSYHYVLGVDASSSASLAAYVNSLSYALVNSQKAQNPWKIKSATFCSFNAFSRVDIRVQVKIPGGVESYAVDLRGDKHQITNPAVWQETFVSAALRAILDDNHEPDGNDGSPILGLRKIDPFQSLVAEKRFLEAAEQEFWKGWQLGTNPEVQVATCFSNHLTNGIMKYFSESKRLGVAVKFFENMFEKDPEVGAVLSQNDEIKGVKVLYDSLKKCPNSYGLLITQVDFLKSKKRLDMAVVLAKLAVISAPSEYVTWAKLTDVYIEMEDYESALLALNSCPMFSYCERDAHRTPVPARTHLPLKPEKAEDQNQNMSGSIDDENDPRESEIHPELARLPSLSLRGTFRLAYDLLIRISTKVGWDALLKFRSKVFVMEEEYRIHRALVEESEKEAQERIKLEEIERASKANEASKVDIVVHDHSGNVWGESSESIQNTGMPEITSPTKAMSSKFLDETDGMETVSLGNDSKPGQLSPDDEGSKGLSIDEILRNASIKETEDPVSGEDAMGTVDGIRKMTDTPNPRPKRTEISLTFRNKRLCEKWLDNLFMVLYNDLRLYTALKQELTQYQGDGSNPAKKVLYRKTGAEWEIYGDLAERLLHLDDAKTAYSLCVEQKFSMKSWLKLLPMAANKGEIEASLNAINKVVVTLDRSFVDTTYPSPIGRAIFQLIGAHGYDKVHNVLIALNVPTRNFKLIMKYFEYAELFKVSGVEL